MCYYPFQILRRFPCFVQYNSFTEVLPLCSFLSCQPSLDNRIAGYNKKYDSKIKCGVPVKSLAAPTTPWAAVHTAAFVKTSLRSLIYFPSGRPRRKRGTPGQRMTPCLKMLYKSRNIPRQIKASLSVAFPCRFSSVFGTQRGLLISPLHGTARTQC